MTHPDIVRYLHIPVVSLVLGAHGYRRGEILCWTWASPCAF